jgi:3-hydroxyisobutyrate dehydrogenase-like beta-hydroxyacid dehydrogenase
MSIKKIGFIGTGIMGSAMVRNLMKAGYQLTVYNRTKAKAEALLSEGAAWADTPKECAKGQDLIITIVGFPKDVREVYLGENGIFEGAKPGAYLIDMTTSDPGLAVELYDKAKAAGFHGMDAPVTGGDSGAKAGTLTILAGGDREDFDTVRPVFEAMGKTIVYTGAAGCGQHTKMCNQIAIAGALSGACEAISYARAVGLDEEMMVNTIATGAAGSFQLSNVAKKGMEGDFNPGFMMKHFIKDMNLADGSAKEHGLNLDITEAVRDICQELADQGESNEGTQALLKHYEKQ